MINGTIWIPGRAVLSISSDPQVAEIITLQEQANIESLPFA